MNTKPTAIFFSKKNLKNRVSTTNNLRYVSDNILKIIFNSKKMMMKILQTNLSQQLHNILCTTLLLITSLFLSIDLKAQCDINDWTALKALYESTDGDNWTNNTEWQQLLGAAPPANCNLDLLYGVTLDATGRVQCIDLDGLDNCESWLSGGNNLSGSIPIEMGNLDNLEFLSLQKNSITGIIPTELSHLNNLEELNLSHNQLSGSIPSTLENLINLTYLRLDYNQLTGTIPKELGNISSLQRLRLNGNDLSGNIPVELGNLSNLLDLFLSINDLDGEIPDIFGNLSNLQRFRVNSNNLEGTIPLTLGNLSNLHLIHLNDNKLTGFIPQFSNPAAKLYTQENYFSCSDLEAFDQNQVSEFHFNPQYIKPNDYNDIKSNVVNSIEIGQKTININPNFNRNTNGCTFKWKRNKVSIDGETNDALNLQNIDANKAGKYTLHIEDQNCTLGTEFISDPMYVIVDGYDLHGKEVEYDEVMVEFESAEKRDKYEIRFLEDGAKGWVKKSCDCNRELHLWKFNSTDLAADALIAINAKHHDVKTKPVVDGGFNTYLNKSNTNFKNEPYEVLSNATNNPTPDNATIFLLDTGFGENDTDNASPYLMDLAPVDECYNIDAASGYNYTNESIDTDFSDDGGWHGTFGFNAITNELNLSNNISVVPIKIFDEEGKGSLFDLTCAIYHAVDHNADIVNISAGYQGQHSGILENAINYARENGVFICTAAGNDALDIDIMPQYPAYFASQYHYVYDSGTVVDSFKYDNVISVAAIDPMDNLSEFSNYGKESVTLGAYGENIYSNGLTADGSSMATYFVTRELALEIASDNSRSYKDIWNDFKNNSLTINTATNGETMEIERMDEVGSMRLNVGIESICNSIEDLIENGDFSTNDYEDWHTTVSPSAEAEFQINDGKANIQITDGGTERADIQLIQHSIPIEKGKRYLISFKAKSSIGRTITLDVSDAANNLEDYFYRSVWLGTNFNKKYFIFEPKVTDNNAQLVFNLGDRVHNVEIDEVVFRELSCSGLNNMIFNSYFDNGTADWSEYVNPVVTAKRSIKHGFHRSWITDGGTGYWHLQVRQNGINIEPGTYTLSFRARSNGSRSINVKLLDPNNIDYHESSKNINTEWKTFNDKIIVTNGTANGRLSFHYGNSTNNLFIDDVILVKEETGNSQRLSNENVSITKEINTAFDLTSALETREDNVKSYPNPFNDKITVELQNLNVNKGTVALYSISGSLIKQQAIENEAMLELNTDDIFPGMYLIKVSTNDKIYTQKLLKQ